MAPHENATKTDYMGYKLLSHFSDLIIFHSNTSKKECERIYQLRSDFVIMPHGNYNGAYPPPRNKFEVIKEIGLQPNKPIVGMIGSMREYKGIDVALKAMEYLDDRAQFLCAGKSHQLFDPGKFKNETNNKNNIVFINRRLSDQEFSDYSNCCDLLLLPYKRITGSGALLAALTFGKGVIASDLPFFKEILNGTIKAGKLVTPEDPKELAIGITEYLNIPGRERMEAALNLSDLYRWEKIILPVVKKLNMISTFDLDAK